MGNEPSAPNDKIDFLRPIQKNAPEPTQINKVQQNEWRIGLQHPHLLQTLGGQPEGDQYRYFFEFCQITLASLLQERYGTKKYFPQEDLQALLLGISSALSFLQEKGLSHGDICATEIFFDSNSSSFKVLDSNLINGRGASIQQLSSGKLKCLSPEIVQNPTQSLSEIQLCKNDVWCLGMVMLEASTLKQNDNLYQNGLQFRLISDRINEVAQIYNLQYAENIALMLNFNANERLDPVNLFNYLLEQQRTSSEQDQVVQQQQYQQLLQQQQFYEQQLCQQQQQQQQQLTCQQSQQQQLTFLQAQQSQLQHQQQAIQYFPQQVEPQKQLLQPSQLQQTQVPPQYFQQQQQTIQQQQYNTQETQHAQQQQYAQTHQPRQNSHQSRPSQDFQMTQPEMNQIMQGGISRERVPTKIIKKLVYPDGRVEYQEKSHSALRMVQQPQQQKPQQLISQYQQQIISQQQLIQQQYAQQTQYNQQLQQQYLSQQQPQYQQRQNILGNIENQMQVVTNEQNITRLKQEIEHSKTLIQQYNQQKPQVQAESIEERIRKLQEKTLLEIYQYIYIITLLKLNQSLSVQQVKQKEDFSQNEAKRWQKQLELEQQNVENRIKQLTKENEKQFKKVQMAEQLALDLYASCLLRSQQSLFISQKNVQKEQKLQQQSAVDPLRYQKIQYERINLRKMKKEVKELKHNDAQLTKKKNQILMRTQEDQSKKAQKI